MTRIQEQATATTTATATATATANANANAAVILLGSGGGLRGGFGCEPFVEGNIEVEELLLIAVFVCEGVNHLYVEFGPSEWIIVELADVVEEVAGESAVCVDCSALEAEVVFVLRDLLVDGLVVDGDGRQGERKRDFAAGGTFGREEAALNVFVGGGGDLVVVNGDELHAGLVERERGVAVVGEDDADGDEAVLDVAQTEEVAVSGVVAGLSGDGDLLFGVGIEGRILIRGLCGGRLPGFVGGMGSNREETRCSYYQERNLRE
jgi:hypothetical protein